MPLINHRSRTIANMKPGNFFLLSRRNSSCVYVVTGETRGPDVQAVVVFDSDQYETQESYIPAGTMYWVNQNEPVQPLKVMRTPEFETT